MHHHVTRTRSALLFHTTEEACRLWARLRSAFPNAKAMCLMGNHVHLQHPEDVRLKLACVMAAHARSLSGRYGPPGQLMEPVPAPSFAGKPRRVRRETRYIHLNPCRAGLVSDPLSWPWSTYREALGLGLRRGVADPWRLHQYTAQDETVEPGSELPMAGPNPDIWQLQGAVSELLCMPIDQLQRRGPGRRLWVQAARELTDLPSREIAQRVGISASAVRRVGPLPEAAQSCIERLAGDPRFPGIPAGPVPWRVGLRTRASQEGRHLNAHPGKRVRG